MVDQNSTPNQPSGNNKPQPTNEASQGLAAPTVVKAGEMMLIFALLLIFAVCVAVSVHLYLRRQKRRRRKESAERKKKSKSVDSAQEKTLAELTGTPLCEMGDSEPRHEMEDAEVHERNLATSLEDPRDSPVYSPAGTDLEAGTPYFGEMSSQTPVQPEAAMHAAYFARF
jgi:uncharacterized protein HemX